MPSSSEEISRREIAARKHIEAIYGKPGDEYGVTLFVSHHLKEINPSYWAKHTGSDKPEAGQILGMLELRIDAEEEDEIEIFDFSLPGGVTDYVISVEFNESGGIVGVSMES